MSAGEVALEPFEFEVGGEADAQGGGWACVGEESGCGGEAEGPAGEESATRYACRASGCPVRIHGAERRTMWATLVMGARAATISR